MSKYVLKYAEKTVDAIFPDRVYLRTLRYEKTVYRVGYLDTSRLLTQVQQSLASRMF